MSYGVRKELAERACVWLNAHPEPDAVRQTIRYVVEAYPNPDGYYPQNRIEGHDYRHDFGVVRKWRYADRPDLGEMGGAFVDLTEKMWA